MPEVSVIMGVCNGRRFLPAAVASVQAQTFPDWELILVDNGSTDGGVDAMLRARPDSRVRVVRYPEALSPAGALAVACQEARGRYLAVLDSDDLAMPRRLEIQRAYLDMRPDICLLATGSELIDDQDNLLGREPHVGTHEDIYALSAYVHVLRHSSVMFRRELLERIQYRNVLAVGTDHDLFTRAAEIGRVEALPAPLCRYRLHRDNLSRHPARRAFSLGLVGMLTHRRRHGLAEDFDLWKRKFAEGEAAVGDNPGRAYLFCARTFATEGFDDLAVMHAWLAIRAGARWRGADRYLRSLLHGMGRARGAPGAMLKGWLKEPAHQLLRSAGGIPDRPQF